MSKCIFIIHVVYFDQAKCVVGCTTAEHCSILQIGPEGVFGLVCCESLGLASNNAQKRSPTSQWDETKAVYYPATESAQQRHKSVQHQLVEVCHGIYSDCLCGTILGLPILLVIQMITESDRSLVRVCLMFVIVQLTAFSAFISRPKISFLHFMFYSKMASRFHKFAAMSQKKKRSNSVTKSKLNYYPVSCFSVIVR